MIDNILQLDKELLLYLNGTWGVGWDTFFYMVSGILTWVPLYLAILYVVYRKCGLKEAIIFMACLVIAVVAIDQIANIFKTFTPKLRPSHNPEIEAFVHTINGYKGGLNGTMSAHAATSFSIAMFTSLFFKRRWYTWSIFFWAILVSYSRIYLGVHFPLDIIFGTIGGLIFGYLGYRVFQKLIVKYK